MWILYLEGRHIPFLYCWLLSFISMVFSYLIWKTSIFSNLTITNYIKYFEMETVSVADSAYYLPNIYSSLHPNGITVSLSIKTHPTENIHPLRLIWSWRWPSDQILAILLTNKWDINGYCWKGLLRNLLTMGSLIWHPFSNLRIQFLSPSWNTGTMPRGAAAILWPRGNKHKDHCTS